MRRMSPNLNLNDAAAARAAIRRGEWTQHTSGLADRHVQGNLVILPKALADDLKDHGCPPGQIASVSIDMSPAFIKGVIEHLPNARITFDKFHVIAHANEAVNKMRRIQQRTDKSPKGMRWSLLKDRSRLKPEAAADLDALIARMTTLRT